MKTENKTDSLKTVDLNKLTAVSGGAWNWGSTAGSWSGNWSGSTQSTATASSWWK